MSYDRHHETPAWCWRIGGPVTLDENGRCPECGWCLGVWKKTTIEVYTCPCGDWEARTHFGNPWSDFKWELFHKDGHGVISSTLFDTLDNAKEYANRRHKCKRNAHADH